MKIKSLLLSIVLAVALLGTLGAVLTDRGGPAGRQPDHDRPARNQLQHRAGRPTRRCDSCCLTFAARRSDHFSTQKTLEIDHDLGTHPAKGVNLLSGNATVCSGE
jgi:hypothetical protein